MQPIRFARTLTGAALALALAAPAGAGTVYSWRTDDGGYAFADDLRRVPEKYRDQVETRESADLADHERYTPQDDAAMDLYAKQLEERLERLRERNRTLDALNAAAASPYAAYGVAPGAGNVVVRLDSRGKPIVEVPQTGPASGQPVIIEDVLGKRPGSVQTRVNTVIRRGDEILSVVRPLDDTQGPGDIHSESRLDQGEY